MPGPRPKKPRKDIRHLVDVSVDVRGSLRPFPASGRDLSFGGIRLRTSGHFTDDERVGLTLHLPDGDVMLGAEVRWIERTHDGREEIAGLEFAHTPESRATMHDVIVKLESGRMRQIQRKVDTARLTSPKTTTPALPGKPVTGQKPRHVARFAVEFPVDVRSPRRSFAAVARDLTDTGIRLRTLGHIEEGERVNLTLRIPGFSTENLSFMADVRWIETDERSAIVGLEFVETPETVRKLRLLFDELAAGNLAEIQRPHVTTRRMRRDADPTRKERE